MHGGSRRQIKAYRQNHQNTACLCEQRGSAHPRSQARVELAKLPSPSPRTSSSQARIAQRKYKSCHQCPKNWVNVRGPIHTDQNNEVDAGRMLYRTDKHIGIRVL